MLVDLPHALSCVLSKQSPHLNSNPRRGISVSTADAARRNLAAPWPWLPYTLYRGSDCSLAAWRGIPSRREGEARTPFHRLLNACSTGPRGRRAPLFSARGARLLHCSFGISSLVPFIYISRRLRWSLLCHVCARLVYTLSPRRWIAFSAMKRAAFFVCKGFFSFTLRDGVVWTSKSRGNRLWGG